MCSLFFISPTNATGNQFSQSRLDITGVRVRLRLFCVVYSSDLFDILFLLLLTISIRAIEESLDPLPHLSVSALMAKIGDWCLFEVLRKHYPPNFHLHAFIAQQTDLFFLWGRGSNKISLKQVCFVIVSPLFLSPSFVLCCVLLTSVSSLECFARGLGDCGAFAIRLHLRLFPGVALGTDSTAAALFRTARSYHCVVVSNASKWGDDFRFTAV
jgi:hypothetical protein